MNMSCYVNYFLWFHPFGITLFFFFLTKVGVVFKAYMLLPCNRRFICDILWGNWHFPSTLFLCFSPLCQLSSLLTLFTSAVMIDSQLTHTCTQSPWLQFKCSRHALPVFGLRWLGMESLLSVWLHMHILLLKTIPLQEAFRLPVTCSIKSAVAGHLKPQTAAWRPILCLYSGWESRTKASFSLL